MAVQLSPADVLSMTGETVTPVDITVGADMIDRQTGYTPDEHNTERDIAVDVVRSAWAVVAARVNAAMNGTGALSITTETQGDYSYSEDVALAGFDRFADVTDGLPAQLLNISKAMWQHI